MLALNKSLWSLYLSYIHLWNGKISSGFDVFQWTKLFQRHLAPRVLLKWLPKFHFKMCMEITYTHCNIKLWVRWDCEYHRNSSIPKHHHSAGYIIFQACAKWICGFPKNRKKTKSFLPFFGSHFLDLLWCFLLAILSYSLWPMYAPAESADPAQQVSVQCARAPHSVKSGSSNYAGTSMGRPATCLGRWKAEAAAWIVSCPNTRCMLHFLIRLHSENIISKINLLRISRRPPQSIKPMLRATFWDTACAWSPALVSYRLES